MRAVAITALAAALLSAGSAAAVTVGPPFKIGAPGNGSGDPGLQFGMAAASDGTNYFMVWMDNRRGPNFVDVIGARVSASGTILDSQVLPISVQPGDQRNPRVTFDGTNYVVAWIDARSYPSYVYAARVTPTGQLLDPAGIPVARLAVPSQLDVASDGNGTFLVWTDTPNGDWNLYGARLSAAGVPGTPFQITSATGTEDQPAVAFNGTHFLVAFTSQALGATNSDLQAVRVSPTGTLVDSQPIVVSNSAGDQRAPTVASDGTNFYVAWEDARAGGLPEIYGTLVGSTGVVQSTQGVLIAPGPNEQRAPQLAFDGTDYLLAYDAHDTADACSLRISKTGALLDPPNTSLAPGQFSEFPAIACSSGAGCLVDYEYGAWYSRDPGFTRVSILNQPLDTGAVTGFASPAAQWSPRGSYDGTNFLVVWEQDYGTTETDVFGARVSQTGAVLDPNGFAIDNAAQSQGEPDVDYGFGEYLVVYTDDEAPIGSRIFAKRVSPSGAVLDTSPIIVSSRTDIEGHPRVSHDGTNFVVAFESYNNVTGSGVFVARVAPDGGVLDPDGFVVADTMASEGTPEIAYNGQLFLVAYGSWDPAVRSDIKAVRLQGTNVLDPDGGILLTKLNEDEYEQTVASDGRNFAVLYRSTTYPSQVYLQRVTPEGAILTPPGIPVGDPINGSAYPAVVHDSRNFWAVWTNYPEDINTHVYAAQITSSGTVVIPDGGLMLSDPNADDSMPNVAAAAPGLLLFLYGEGDFDAGVTRLRGRTLTGVAPNGGWCHTNADCQSLYCVDGVCCDTACGGGAPDDCQACAEDAGAAVDGTCGAANSGRVCRASVDSCDVPESCDGISLSCPQDQRIVDGGGCTFSSDGGSDGGVTDGGRSSDGGPALTRRTFRVGEGCAATDLPPLLAAAVLGLFGMLRRRKAR